MSEQKEIFSCTWNEYVLKKKFYKKFWCIFCNNFISKRTKYYYTKDICIYYNEDHTAIGGYICCKVCKPQLFNIILTDLFGNVYNKIEIYSRLCI